MDSVAAHDGVFPDHNNATFLQYHERIVRAFGDRHAGSPDIDHVDIGSVGRWEHGLLHPQRDEPGAQPPAPQPRRAT